MTAGPDATEPTLVWERPEPPSRPAPSPLSRDRIVRAAIDLADTDGLGAVSLRKVAAALDAGPMRLYGYLSTKEELLDLMVDAVYGEIQPPADSDWRAALRSLAHATREAAHRHEWFVDLLGGRPRLGPNELTFIEASLTALDGVPGFANIDTVLQATSAVHAYVVGAVCGENTELRAEHTTETGERQWQVTAGPYLTRMMATGRYPTLAKALRDSRPADPDTTFEAGLDYVLDGIAANLIRDN